MKTDGSHKNLLQNELDRLLQLKKELVDGIRNYARAQKELWRQIPCLALEADGRTGFSDSRARAYQFGYWTLTSSEDRLLGGYGIYVDCATGELIRPSKPNEMAHDNYVLALAYFSFRELDAAGIIEELRRHAQEPIGSCYSAEEQKKHEEWREKKRKELNLQRVYVRKQHFPAEAGIEVGSFSPGD
jgi:hypothetical protein